MAALYEFKLSIPRFYVLLSMDSSYGITFLIKYAPFNFFARNSNDKQKHYLYNSIELMTSYNPVDNFFY